MYCVGQEIMALLGEFVCLFFYAVFLTVDVSKINILLCSLPY